MTTLKTYGPADDVAALVGRIKALLGPRAVRQAGEALAQKNLHTVSAEVDRRAVAYAHLHSVGYSQALREVLNADSRLKAAYNSLPR